MVTGWGYREIMEDVPFAAGLQIIDSDLVSKGIPRIYGRTSNRINFDGLADIEAAFEKIK